MKKFERTQPKVTKYMGKGGAASDTVAAATDEQDLEFEHELQA
jgi:hypothetical protein